MSGIAGFYNISGIAPDMEALQNMKEKVKHRGVSDTFCTEQVAIANATSYRNYAIVLDGELYNRSEIAEAIRVEDTLSDEELFLRAYIYYGINVPEKLNGTFAGVIYDKEKQLLILFRDRFGVKPLFFTFLDKMLVFASEMKALFEYPGVDRILDENSLCELFGLGPARTEGVGVFKNIHEIKQGNFALYSSDGFRQYEYFKIVAEEHTSSYEETLENTKYLLEDSIKRQLGGEDICCFLSGGLDSSIVTGIYAQQANKQIDTISFDFIDNDKYFEANSFQPSLDRPWVEKVSSHYKTKHEFLMCHYEVLADTLYDSVLAKDLPGMADIDSSLLYFCRETAKKYKIALTGECSDEIFAGYPWFHNEEIINSSDTFPWSRDLSFRKQFLKDELLAKLPIDEYVKSRYDNSIDEVPRLAGESGIASRRREISYLTMKWFMTTLIDRADRAAAYTGLTARVPYCDYRLVSYLYNVPYEYKCKDGVVKSLLRDAAGDLLPQDVLMRKKSPYPKTYNPFYENILKDRLKSVLEDSSSPILNIVDKQKIYNFMDQKSCLTIPWYGQLMATPQMLAYLLQLNYWLKEYKIELSL